MQAMQHAIFENLPLPEDACLYGQVCGPAHWDTEDVLCLYYVLGHVCDVCYSSAMGRQREELHLLLDYKHSVRQRRPKLRNERAVVLHLVNQSWSAVVSWYQHLPVCSVKIIQGWAWCLHFHKYSYYYKMHWYSEPTPIWYSILCVKVYILGKKIVCRTIRKLI